MMVPFGQKSLSAKGAFVGSCHPTGLPPLARGRGYGNTALTNLRTRFRTRCGVLPLPFEVRRDPTSFFRISVVALSFLAALEELVLPAEQGDSVSETISVGIEWVCLPVLQVAGGLHEVALGISVAGKVAGNVAIASTAL